jgi:TonB family protein
MPFNSLGWGLSGRAVVRFDIDSSGRPVSIKSSSGDDAAAAVAASRFSAQARQHCSATFSAPIQPLEVAPLADLVAYTVSPVSGPLPPQGWARIRSAGDCQHPPRQQPLLRAYPDFDAIPARPGVKDWAMIGYDTDARGRPLRAHVVSGTGNRLLDAAATTAVRNSRFTGGARTACLYPYWRAPAVLPAPVMPGKGTYQDMQDACPRQGSWANLPVLRFPPSFARRRIEGWAILSYDVAPWGEIGNVKVLEAQPAEEFGRQAMQILRVAKAPASPQGASGCVERVKFVMPREDAEAGRNDSDGGSESASDEIPMIG